MGMMKFSVSFEQRNCRNEHVCGDAVAVDTDESTGITHVAVIDGLGHGPAAHMAADAFVSYFRDNIKPELSLVDFFAWRIERRCSYQRGGSICRPVGWDERRNAVCRCGKC